MFMMHRPSDEQIRVFIATQRDQPFSYLDTTTNEC